MSGVRRGADVALRYLLTIFLLGVVAQFFLVGIGIFGMKDGDTVAKAKSLDPHRGLGFILTEPVALLILLLAAIAWRGRRRFGLYVLFAVDAFVQGILAGLGEDSKFVGMLHPVNALVVLGLSGYLTRLAWAEARERAPETAAVVSPAA